MKRAGPWGQSYPVSSDDSSDSDSDSDSESDDGQGNAEPNSKNAVDRAKDITPEEPNSKNAVDCAKDITSEGRVNSGKKKGGVLDYDALSRHGYSGGLSILNMPPPKAVVDEKEQDWSWSIGKRSGVDKEEVEESFEDRERTRAAIAQGERLVDMQTRKDKKNLSFSQKEKRKRELGQASRGKNYVEEEKRLLRDSGIYSGFDS